MNRRSQRQAKPHTEPPPSVPQGEAVPTSTSDGQPVASDPLAATPEERLILTGKAMLLAQTMQGRLPTLEEVAHELAEMGPDDAKDLAEIHPLFRDLGKQDPRPFADQLRQLCEQLRSRLKDRNMDEDEQLVGQMLSTLSHLELVLAVRRYGGRPRGKRHKVTPEQVGTIRRWEEGDRSEITSGSVADVAKKLALSRQTVYTILKEMAEDRPE